MKTLKPASNVSAMAMVMKIDLVRSVVGKLWETFPSTLAESNIEDYGKVLYPYGFKFRGATKEKALNDTTWYIEGNCNITNAFGGVAKDQQFSAQATIDKNTGKVSVHDFQVF